MEIQSFADLKMEKNYSRKRNEDENHIPRNSTEQMRDTNIQANCILKDTRLKKKKSL